MGMTYPVDAALRPRGAGIECAWRHRRAGRRGRHVRHALEAGVRYAAVARALELVRTELAATKARQRALERRWVPLLSGELRHLEAELDELEREDAVRYHWPHARAEPRA
jgi:vacuolar-type H+-ATPase subunit D/Vma8